LFSQVKSEHFFGIEKVWIGEASIFITGLEKILLDGLHEPKNTILTAQATAEYKINKLSRKKIIY